MKVTVVRTGGFAGIQRRGEGDTTADPALRTLVDRVDLSAVPPPGRVPDQFTYEIEIDGRTAAVGEAQLTGPLRDLVEHILA
jgi:emfourin